LQHVSAYMGHLQVIFLQILEYQFLNGPYRPKLNGSVGSLLEI
jgi:hypothetical protein